MAKNEKEKEPEELRGQLMLQIAAGRFFRPDVSIKERPHRRTVYSNAWFVDLRPVDLPVGKIIGSTDIDDISTATIVDRLGAAASPPGDQ